MLSALHTLAINIKTHMISSLVCPFHIIFHVLFISSYFLVIVTL